MQAAEDKILTTVEELIRFHTIDERKDEINKAADYIKRFFEGVPVFIREHHFNGYPALVITTRDTKNPKIFLQGHVDVVEAEPKQFEPLRKEDRLYGRGSVDMKAFDAMAMHLVRAAAFNQLDLGLMLTFDEEIGGQNGAAKLAELDYCPEILINGDGGYNHAVIHAEKGILKIKLCASSNSGRHPYPWEGENAFDILVREYQKIRQMFPEQTMATDTDNWHTTCSSYDVKVKNDAFMAPHYAEMKINIYFTDDLTAGQLYQRIQSRIKQVKISKITGSERVFLPEDNPYLMELREIMQKNFSEPIVIRSENGSSDARYFTHKGFPILIVKVVGEGHHTPEEYLHIPSLMPLYHSLDVFIQRHARREITITEQAVANE